MRLLSVVVVVGVLHITSTLAEERSIEEIVVERVEFPMGSTSPLMRYIDMRVKKFNRTLTVIDGSVEMLMPITDDMKYQYDIYYHVSGSQYNLLFSKPHNHFCSGLSKGLNSKVMEALYENAGLLSTFRKCPQTLGKVTLHNFFANTELGTPFLGPLTLKEKWKCTLTVMDQEGTVLNQVDTYVRIRNKFSD